MNTTKVKRYAVLCLWTFLLPQLSNVVHFLIIPHEVSRTHKQSVEWTKAKKGHYCEQHWFDSPSTLPNSIIIEVPIVQIDVLHRVLLVKEIYLKVFDFIRFLRGPPIELDYLEFKI